MFQMLCGYLPFSNNEDLQANYYEEHFKGNDWKSISFEARDLIDNLLEEDPHKRFSA